MRANINIKEKDIKDKFEEDLKKILPEERIYRFLGTTIILMRAEAKGPIIGIDEVGNSNRRRPSPNAPGGFVALDDKGEIIEPTISYFGKYDRDEQKQPVFLIPTTFKITKYSIFFEGKEDEKFKLNLFVNSRNWYDDKDKFFTIHTDNIKKESLYCSRFIAGGKFYEKCNNAFLVFEKSHPNVTRFFITFVCVLHFSDFDHSWLHDSYRYRFF